MEEVNTVRLLNEGRLRLKRYVSRLEIGNSQTSNSSGSDSFAERRSKIVQKNSFYPSTAKQSCRYGISCFRKQNDHFLEFSHPRNHPFVIQLLQATPNRSMKDKNESTAMDDLMDSGNRKSRLYSDFDLRDSINRPKQEPHFDLSQSLNPGSIIQFSFKDFNMDNAFDSDSTESSVTTSAYGASGTFEDEEEEDRNAYNSISSLQSSTVSVGSDGEFGVKEGISYGEHVQFGVAGVGTVDAAKQNELQSDFGRTWNDEFQRIVDAVRHLSAPNTKQEKRKDVYQQLADLGKNFISSAKNYGKIIISEVNLDDSRKTIKPLQGKGFAGGDKYFVQGIYFKFAVDSANLFGGDNGAVKVAGHELRSLTQVFNCWVKTFHVPMAVLVDYRGFRLIAMSTLPINESSIVYGTHNASGKCEVHVSDAQVRSKMEYLGKILNLRKHRAGSDGVEICTPVDLEAHIGDDKKVYLLDFARLFPPIHPEPTIQSSYLVNLFRPEFVRTYPKPLCSDAFSSFVYGRERNIVNDEACEATRALLFSAIPKFATQLCAMKPEVAEKYPLIESLHHNGINVRYLGLIRAYLPKTSKYWRFTIIIEMVVRTIKQMMQSKLRGKAREIRIQGDEHFKKIIVKEINLIFGNREESTQYWKSTLLNQLKEKFMITGVFISSTYAKKPSGVLFPHTKDFDCFNSEGKPIDYSLKSAIVKSSKGLNLLDGRCILFKEVATVLGLQFSSNAQRAFTDPSLFEFQYPFDEVDLEDIRERVKHMNIISHAEGFVLKIKAARKPAEESGQLYSLAIDRFKKALSSNPDNKNSLRNLADCYDQLDAVEEANIYYQRAIDCDPSDTYTLFKYACFLDKLGSEKTEEYYLQALEGDPYHCNALCVYADWLGYVKEDVDGANDVYEAALRIDSSNQSLLNNYACHLLKQKKYDEAEGLFKEAVKKDQHAVVYRNYTILLMKMKRLKEAKETWAISQQQRRY